jgi:hypothetical protein
MEKLKINRDINYLNRDFTQFRQQLINYSKTYFPNMLDKVIIYMI